MGLENGRPRPRQIPFATRLLSLSHLIALFAVAIHIQIPIKSGPLVVFVHTMNLGQQSQNGHILI